jgi:hypothetical protein
VAPGGLETTAPVDHRHPIGARGVPSVIHALQSVGKTTTLYVVVF